MRFTMLVSSFIGMAWSYVGTAAPTPVVNVCNKMVRSVWLVKGHESPASTAVTSDGWWEVKPGSCRDMVWSGAAVGDTFYLYGHYHEDDDDTLFELEGTRRLCIHETEAFNYSDAATRTCDQPNQVFKKFRAFQIPEDGKLSINLTDAAFMARANLVRACNKTNVTIWSARGYQVAGQIEPETKGWNEIKAGQCLNLMREEVSPGDAVYFYAEYQGSDQFNYELKGDTRLCLNVTDAFAFDSAASRACDQANQAFKKFRRYKIDAEGKLEINVTEGDFFKRPMKLRACNKLDQSLWMVRGFESRGFTGPTTMGWYEVKSGECLGLFWDEATLGDQVYLYGYYKTADGSMKEIKGEPKLCIERGEAFTYDNAALRSCNESGQTLKVFKKYAIPDDGILSIDLNAGDFG